MRPSSSVAGDLANIVAGRPNDMGLQVIPFVADVRDLTPTSPMFGSLLVSAYGKTWRVRVEEVTT